MKYCTIKNLLQYISSILNNKSILYDLTHGPTFRPERDSNNKAVDKTCSMLHII